MAVKVHLFNDSDSRRYLTRVFPTDKAVFGQGLGVDAAEAFIKTGSWTSPLCYSRV